MKYLPLLWAALWRRRPRTILTGLSIAVSFLLFGLLTAFNQAMNSGVEMSGSHRLVITGKYSLTQLLPYGHLQQILHVDGVSRATHASWFGGVYQEERNFFPQFATDVAAYLALYPEMLMPQAQHEALALNRTGAVVARTLADRFGWKIGDRIPIQATIWPKADRSNAWEFDLVGIFDTADPRERGQYEMMLLPYTYFDEARQFGRGYVGWYIADVAGGHDPAAVAHRIDTLFANSPFPTKSQTEKAFNQAFLKQLGDIGFIISSIMGAVLFTLLLLTGNTMMQSVRERIPELAVLKTIGFSDGQVLGLVLAEAAALCLAAAALGIGFTAILLPLLAPHLPGGFAGMGLSASALWQALGMAAVLAAVVGIPPAWKAMRLDIVQALAGH